MDVPTTWIYRPATEDWPPYTYPEAGAAYTDALQLAFASFPVLDISTQQLPPGQTAQEWLAALDAESERRGYDVLEESEIVVDGVTGRLQNQQIGPENIWEIIVFDDASVYAIYWVGLVSARDVDEPAFLASMATFRFPD